MTSEKSVPGSGEIGLMKIGVLGAGSWGTTLADLLARKGYPVDLWVFERDLAETLRATRENQVYLPGFPLAPNLSFTCDMEKATTGKGLVLLVPPSQVLRRVTEQALSFLAPGALVVSAAKGIETDTLLPMSAVLEQLIPAGRGQELAFLSGPTFAREVAAQMPTAVVAAAKNPEVARRVQEVFNTDYFRVYTNEDVIGVEIGGALKNVIALAAGVSDGLGFGYNTRAALITRGLAEMSRLGVAMGADPATFAGLAGMGDLVLTCTGDLSRNRSVGMELGRGRKLEEILKEMKLVAEGVKTTQSAYDLARKLGVQVPIIEQMHAILYQGKDPRRAVSDLMLRELKGEKE